MLATVLMASAKGSLIIVVVVVNVIVIVVVTMILTVRQDNDRASNGSFPEEAVLDDGYRQGRIGILARDGQQSRETVVRDIGTMRLVSMVRGDMVVIMIAVVPRRSGRSLWEAGPREARTRWHWQAV